MLCTVVDCVRSPRISMMLAGISTGESDAEDEPGTVLMRNYWTDDGHVSHLPAWSASEGRSDTDPTPSAVEPVPGR